MAGDDDRIQRALNEAKREELRQKYGAEFRSGSRAIPPEVESHWLHEIEEFERRFDQAAQVTVRRFVGDPPVRPLGDIPPEELPAETDRLLELLRCNNIEICFGHDLSDGEMYRFITDEIFLQTIADLRIEGLTLTFLYEEFHPDPVREVCWAAEDFLRAIFERNDSVLLGGGIPLCRQDGSPATSPIDGTILSLLGTVAVFLEWRAEVITSAVEGSDASVSADISWSGLDAASLETVSASGIGLLHLRLQNGLWVVTAAELPGMTCRR